MLDAGLKKLHKLLGFRPRDHRAFVAKKDVSAKFHRAEQMLERLALSASPRQLAQRGQLGFAENPFELEIKFHARSSQHVCEQVLSVQARIIDITLLEMRGHRLQYLEDRHTSFAPTPSIVIPSGARNLSPLSMITLVFFVRSFGRRRHLRMTPGEALTPAASTP